MLPQSAGDSNRRPIYVQGFPCVQWENSLATVVEKSSRIGPSEYGSDFETEPVLSEACRSGLWGRQLEQMHSRPYSMRTKYRNAPMKRHESSPAGQERPAMRKRDVFSSHRSPCKFEKLKAISDSAESNRQSDKRAWARECFAKCEGWTSARESNSRPLLEKQRKPEDPGKNGKLFKNIAIF